MVQGIILQLCTLLLLLQLATVTRASSEKELTETQLNHLNNFTTEAFSKAAKSIVVANKKLFEAVIREGSASKNRQLQTHLSTLSEFVEKVNKWEVASNDTDKLIELVSEVADLHDQFDSDEVKNPTEDILLMEELLKKHGSEQVLIEAVNSFLEFFGSFLMQLEQYVSSQNQHNSKLSDWHQSYKSEKDLGKRLELFTKLVEFFPDR